jgi:multiple sugar transport system permease protein
VETLTMIAYDEATNLRYGPAAAYATILFVYVAVVAYAFVKLLGADIIGDMRQTRTSRPARPKNKPLTTTREVTA